MTLEEVNAEYQAIKLRWHSESHQGRDQSLDRLQALLNVARELPDEGSEMIEVELEDLINQLVTRIHHDNDHGRSS